MLADHHAGLVALTACLSGEVPERLLGGDEAAARGALGQLCDIFGREHVFLELMDHGLDEQKRVNAGLLRLQREFGLPLVATNDVHYVDQADAHAQDVLVCIQFPEMGILAGYAVTATVDTTTPGGPKPPGARWALYEALAGAPRLAIVVLQAVGPNLDRSCVCGGVMASTI